jgi:hypothetical protein
MWHRSRIDPPAVPILTEVGRDKFSETNNLMSRQRYDGACPPHMRSLSGLTYTVARASLQSQSIDCADIVAGRWIVAKVARDKLKPCSTWHMHAPFPLFRTADRYVRCIIRCTAGWYRYMSFDWPTGFSSRTLSTSHLFLQPNQ